MTTTLPIGRKFNRLVIVAEAERDKHNYRRVVVKCECGTTKTILWQQLTSGKTKSCGCLNKENRERIKRNGWGPKIPIDI